MSILSKKITTLIGIFFLCSSVVCCQTKRITGKIIDETFQTISGAGVFTSDKILLCKTDSSGSFSIDLPTTSNYLRFGSVGLEWKYVRLQIDCNYLEVIFLLHSTYDFITLHEVDRLRRKEFRQLPKLHLKGFEKGVLSTKRPCYEDIFISVAEN